jgi:hypothetical protein
MIDLGLLGVRALARVQRDALERAGVDLPALLQEGPANAESRPTRIEGR